MRYKYHDSVWISRILIRMDFYNFIRHFPSVLASVEKLIIISNTQDSVVVCQKLLYCASVCCIFNSLLGISRWGQTVFHVWFITWKSGRSQKELWKPSPAGSCSHRISHCPKLPLMFQIYNSLETQNMFSIS